MSSKVRVSFGRGNVAEVINASREKIEVKGPEWPAWVEVKPNNRFTGNYRHRRIEPITPVVPDTVGATEYPFSVRRATEDDIDALCLMVPRLMAETSLLPVSQVKIQRMIERCALCEGGAIAGIIDGPDGIDGSIGLDVAESETSDHRYVRAIWLGLHPELRENPPRQNDPRSSLGRLLFAFARWYHAKLEEAAGYPVLMQFDVMTRVELGPKLGFYERNAIPIGASFAFVSSGGMFLKRDAAEAA